MGLIWILMKHAWSKHEVSLAGPEAGGVWGKSDEGGGGGVIGNC